MKAPQIILTVLILLGVAFDLYEAGATKDQKTLWASLVSKAVTVSLLWWGGFWK